MRLAALLLAVCGLLFVAPDAMAGFAWSLSIETSPEPDFLPAGAVLDASLGDCVEPCAGVISVLMTVTRGGVIVARSDIAGPDGENTSHLEIPSGLRVGDVIDLLSSEYTAPAAEVTYDGTPSMPALTCGATSVSGRTGPYVSAPAVQAFPGGPDPTPILSNGAFTVNLAAPLNYALIYYGSYRTTGPAGEPLTIAATRDSGKCTPPPAKAPKPTPAPSPGPGPKKKPKPKPPALTGVKLTHSAERVEGIVVLGFRDSEKGYVRLLAEKRSAGHRSGKRCVAGHKKGHKTCTRVTKLKTVKRTTSTGKNVAAIQLATRTVRISRSTYASRLAPGSYAVVIAPYNSAGTKGRSHMLKFIVKRQARHK